VVVTKKTSRREYNIQKKLHKLLPKFVPKPISYTRGGVMKSKKSGVSLKKWLRIHKFTNSMLIQIIKNVRLILCKIRRKYPGFRHMDLHLDNVLMNNGRILIIDFGLSKFKSGNTSVHYDMHLFLNSLRNFLYKKGRKLPYLERALPEGFRGAKGKYVQNFRLKNYSSESAASIAKRLTGLRA
jgi:tRNA A-37 threonylcarbamoyl transferase component Bud32